MSDLSLALDTPDLAHHYEQISRDRQFKAGQLLVSRLGIKTGERVLDVGSGTGLLAEHTAGIVGPSGSVVGIDPLTLRVDIASKKATRNLSFAVGDAYDLTRFDDASFDVIYLNAVFHWLPEKSGPLRQFHRILATGGRLGISTGSKDHPNRLHEIKREVLSREPYSQYPESKAGAPERVSAAELRRLLEQTGFDVEAVDSVPHVSFQPSGEAAIQFSQASSFGNFLNHLPNALRAAAREEIRVELERQRTPEGIRQDGARLIAIAVKASAGKA